MKKYYGCFDFVEMKLPGIGYCVNFRPFFYIIINTIFLPVCLVFKMNYFYNVGPNLDARISICNEKRFIIISRKNSTFQACELHKCFFYAETIHIFFFF